MRDNLTLLTPSIHGIPLRFGTGTDNSSVPAQTGAESQNSLQEWREFLKNRTAKVEDVKFKPVNAPAPETPLSRGKSRLKQVVYPLLIAMAALGIGGKSWTAVSGSIFRSPFSAYSENQTNRARINPNWHKLEEVAQTAQKTKGQNNPEMVGQFVDRYNGFLFQVVEVLKAHPGFLDKTLQEKLATSPDFRPKSNLRSYASNYIEFMKREINNLGVKYDPDQPNTQIPGPDVINQVDIKGKFLANLPELGIPEHQRDAFASALKETFKKSVASPLSSDFVDIFVAAIGTGVDGVTLQEFAGASGKQDAIRLVDKTIANANNFKNWTPAERQALSGRIHEVLGAVNSQSYDITMLFLLSAAALGGAAVTALNAKKFVGLVQALTSDIPKGLKEIMLIVNTADTANPQVRQYMDDAFGMLKIQSQGAADLFKASYEGNSDVREQWKALGKSEKDLPTANVLLEQVFHDVKEQMKANRTFNERLNETPLNELTFLQAMVNHFELVKETGELFIKQGLPQGAVIPGEQDIAKALKEAKDPVDVLRLKRQQIQFRLQEARKLLLQQSLKVLQADTQIEQHNKALAVITREAQALGTITDATKRDKKRNELGDRTVTENEQLAIAQKQKDKLEEALLLIKLDLSKIFSGYQDYLTNLTESIQGSAQTDQLKVLIKLKEDSEKDLSDVRLQEIIHDEKVKKVSAEILAKQAGVKVAPKVNTQG